MNTRSAPTTTHEAQMARPSQRTDHNSSATAERAAADEGQRTRGCQCKGLIYLSRAAGEAHQRALFGRVPQRSVLLLQLLDAPQRHAQLAAAAICLDGLQLRGGLAAGPLQLHGAARMDRLTEDGRIPIGKGRTGPARAGAVHHLQHRMPQPAAH
jgi:hypothetical protein